MEKLLFLARGDNNTMNLQPEHFDLARLAEEVLKEFRMIDSGHEYDSHIESSVWVLCGQGTYQQALRILMDNAIKYTNAGGNIAP